MYYFVMQSSEQAATWDGSKRPSGSDQPKLLSRRRPRPKLHTQGCQASLAACMSVKEHRARLASYKEARARGEGGVCLKALSIAVWYLANMSITEHGVIGLENGVAPSTIWPRPGWLVDRQAPDTGGGPVQVWQDARRRHQVVMATRHEAKISAMDVVRA